jgi:hypothetical protein
MTDLKVLRSTRNMPLSQSFLPAALVVLFALSMTGCGGSVSEINRKPVFGKVLGAEGRDGYVAYYPKDTSIGPAVTAELEDGEYEFASEFGPVPGEYEVEIGFETTGRAPQNEGGDKGGNRKGAGRRAAAASLEEGRMTEATVPTAGPYEIDLDAGE